MQCPKCGWNNPDDARKCSNCFADIARPPQAQPTQQMQQPPPQPQQPQPPYGQQQTNQSYAQQAQNRQQPQQQPYGRPAQYGQPYFVPDYMVWSIVATAVFLAAALFCCQMTVIPASLGIVAIVKSAQANCRKSMGDYATAMQDANTAKIWLWVTVGVGAVIVALGVIVGVLYAGFVTSMMRGMPGMPHP